jgi:hypothetical protein|tara:strand:- start:605 stop:1195 length:591 start_codon:yes stop_codon:yes gene_type:complete
MTEIYIEISKLTDKFRTMCYGITTDENKIHEAVQELMLYLLQANPDVIKKIYNNDGIEGITKYGAVALKRALTSKRSNFYYKYEKYYTHVDNYYYNSNSTISENSVSGDTNFYNNLVDIPNPEVDNVSLNKLEMIDVALDKKVDYWYDRELFKLYYYEEGNTLDSIHNKTGISRNSIFTTIDKVRTIIKKELNEDV